MAQQVHTALPVLEMEHEEKNPKCTCSQEYPHDAHVCNYQWEIHKQEVWCTCCPECQYQCERNI